MKFDPNTMVDVASFGYDNASILLAIASSVSTPVHKDLYFRTGVYTINNIPDSSYFGGRIIGQGKKRVTITNDKSTKPLVYIGCLGAIGVTLNDITFSSLYLTNISSEYFAERNEEPKFILRDNKINWSGYSSDTYILSINSYVPVGEIPSVEIENNDIAVGACYRVIDITWCKDLKIIGNKIKCTGQVTHIVRINPQYNKDSVFNTEKFENSYFIISDNTIDASDCGAITGIMFASTRYGVINGPVIERNRISGIDEEAISFDSFGNNWDLCSTICTGSVSSIANDSNGRLVFTFGTGIKSVNELGQVTANISDRDDWTKFRFMFNRDTGLDGACAKIYSYSSYNNTITLDLNVSASKLLASGVYSVQGGFFGGVVRHNEIFGTNGTDPNYGTGISLWINCFGFEMSNNFICGMPNGIDCSAGLMLSTYETTCWNNTITNNRIIGSATSQGIRVAGVYGQQSYQYGNIITDNIVDCANIIMSKQKKFIVHGNYADHLKFSM